MTEKVSLVIQIFINNIESLRSMKRVPFLQICHVPLFKFPVKNGLNLLLESFR